MTDYNNTYVFSYETEYSDEVCHIEDILKVVSYLIPIFFTLVFVLSFIGNIMVLIILVVYENMKSLANIFILNLALSDLLFTFGLPFWTSYYMWGCTFGDFGCKAVKFLFYAGFYSSVLFLTLMTVQHYVAVVHPLSDWERCRGFSVAPFIVWILSGAAALFGSYHSKVIQEENNTYCEFDSIPIKLLIDYLLNAFFLIAFIIMGFCCIRILQTITKAQTTGRHETVGVIFCILLVFFIFWAPYNIVMFVRSFTDLYLITDCPISKSLGYAFYVSKVLAYSHCCLNPVFYLFVDLKFRNDLKIIMQIFLSKTPLQVKQRRSDVLTQNVCTVTHCDESSVSCRLYVTNE
ncbi:chemokine XC receptor 1-like [Misgurnus anguillicaudatus]|uniref:chemokine XC receptor 1-like n=1 Tax=Misgurnus anguillicaudatus TaxID=75329 RepID=UPI003CCFBA0B